MKFKTLPEIEIDLDKNRTPNLMGPGFRNPITDGIERLRNIAMGNYYNFYLQLKEEIKDFHIEQFAEYLKVDERLSFFVYAEEIEEKMGIYNLPATDSNIKIPIVRIVNIEGAFPSDGLVEKKGELVQEHKVGIN